MGRITPETVFLRSEESRRYTFGPSVDLSLTGKWSVTVNPLYKRTGGSSSAVPFLFIPSPESPFQYLNQSTRSRAHSLELPVIGKYRFGGRWHPFVGTGFAFQTAWQSTEGRFVTRNAETGALTFSDFQSDRRTQTDTGVVLSTGFAFRRGPLEFSPEIRYTRWGTASPARDRQQADALLTIRFGGRGH